MRRERFMPWRGLQVNQPGSWPSSSPLTQDKPKWPSGPWVPPGVIITIPVSLAHSKWDIKMKKRHFKESESRKKNIRFSPLPAKQQRLLLAPKHLVLIPTSAANSVSCLEGGWISPWTMEWLTMTPLPHWSQATGAGPFCPIASTSPSDTCRLALCFHVRSHSQGAGGLSKLTSPAGEDSENRLVQPQASSWTIATPSRGRP